MYLEVKLSKGVDSTELKSMIHKSIMEAGEGDSQEIKAWSIENIDYGPNKLIGINHKTDQFKDLGWLHLVAGEELLSVDFYPWSGKEVDDEQIIVLLFRFASMLRKYFRNSIVQMSILKI